MACLNICDESLILFGGTDLEDNLSDQVFCLKISKTKYEAV